MSKVSMKAVAVATVIGGAIAGAVSASAALNLPTQSCSYTFNKNVKLGSRGTDVMNLQKVLNAYPQTQVASSGAGSPGNETTYFGAATRAAVNKFQALHLVELGITAPTGNVFAGTRGLLNAICVGGNAGTGNNGNGNGGTVISGPVSAMLAASQPTGMLVQGQAGARLADLTFTGNGTVTSVQLQRVGVSADTALTNVYLYDGNTRITDAASVVTGGFINFNNPNGLFTVSGSRTITVRADIAGSTNGNSVGVKLNSVTAGGAVSTFSNVIGNALQVGSAQVASSTLTMNTGSSPVNAGAVSQTVWSGVDQINTRSVLLRALTLKFVGSAPADFLANANLYVDSVKVAGPSAINAANNNKLTFDLGATPYVMNVGSHTIEVRGDIVKGSSRTYQFSIENVADLMLEDSSLVGVNVPTYVGSSLASQSNTAYTNTTISTGSVTVNVDPAFNATKVTGGATNVPVAQYTLKAYGEDVKVNSLQVSFASTTVATLNNVSLYVNGGQVGTSQNLAATGTPLTYNLGSSLIIPANTTVTLTVKADIVNTAGTAYSSGTIVVDLGGVAQNAQGQNSNLLTDVANPAQRGNSLTIGSGAGTFARTSGFAASTVSPNTSNVKIGSFTLQANSSEDVKVNAVAVGLKTATYNGTNLSNLKVVSNGVTLGTPVGNPSSANAGTVATTTFSFPEIVVPANGVRTFDVYADIGSASSGTVTADVSVSYRGAISNTTTSSSAAGVAITSAVSSLATPTLSASSPVAQFVVGGSTFGIATYTLKTADAGTVANVREMRFSTTGTDAIESITVGGVTAPVVNGSSTVTGLNIQIGSTGTDVPVTVKFAGYQNSTSGGSLTSTVGNTSVSLSYVEATSGTGTVINNTTIVPSNTMVDVASKPTVTVGAGNTNTLVLGSENKIGEFTVTADANGKIALATTTLTVSPVNFTSAEITLPRVVTDGSATTTGAIATGSSTITIGFTPAFEIAAGTSKTFSVYATVNGVLPTSGTPYIASRLGSSSLFKWLDVVGGNTVETGASIFNFPTNSYTTAR